MYGQFKDNNISHPKTKIISKNNDKINSKYPYLVKDDHSCGGKGVLLENLYFKRLAKNIYRIWVYKN